MLVQNFLNERFNHIGNMRAFREVSNRIQLPSVDRKALAKKNLFGPVDPESLISFVHEELRKKEKCASERWGYDFSKDRPIASHKRFAWKPIVKTAAPRVYTLTHSAHIRQLPVDRRCEYSTEEEELMDERADRANEDHQKNATERISAPAADLLNATATRSGTQATNTTSPTKSGHKRIASNIIKKKIQPKITDYLKQRKRPMLSKSKLHDEVAQHRPSTSMQTRSSTLTSRQLMDRH